jgi:hypothetical protein
VSDRTETAIAVLVMAAAGLVIGAPILGRLGFPHLADVAMASAALCGVGAFAVAGVHTFHAGRRGGARDARGAARPDEPGGRSS